MDKILIIDGNSIINRAFYGLPVLANSKGEYTNAVYGFFNIILKFVEDEKATHIAVAFDLSKPTFRHNMFDEYKAGRKSMPEELRPQFPLLKNMLKLMNITIFEIEGYEADDILGTLSRKLESDDTEVIIISGDRDTLQLATKNTTIRIPTTKGGKTIVKYFDENEVIEQYGVTPTEFIDVKALMGDASDNIPGVPSIGEKTATKIIQQYKDIETAIENAADVKPKKASENLIEFAEQARMSKVLATINVNVPIEINKDDIVIRDMFNNESYEEVQRLELRSFYKKFQENVKNESEQQIVTVDNPFDIDDAIKTIENANKIALDLVCVFDDIWVSLSCDEDKSVIFVTDDTFSINDVMESLKNVLETKEVIMLDSKRCELLLHKLGIDVDINVAFDTGIAMYILNPSKPSYNVEDVALQFLNENVQGYDDVFGKGRNSLNKDSIDNDELKKYVANQSIVAYKSYNIINEQLAETEQKDLYYDIEFPLIEVLRDMEIQGIKVEKDELIEYGKKLDQHINELTKKIYEHAECEFNINSPSQVGEILFEKLGLKGGKKTKTGYSTAVDVLEKIKFYHPIVSEILDYRTYAKLKSTYVDGLINVINEDTGKIHSSFNQTITATGRISSTNPNLQNIPIRTQLGRELRKVFVPQSDEYTFVSADYSQIELRILAHISGDEVLINAFNNGEDIHRLTASQVFNIPLDEVTSRQRSNAKAVNFGIVYGISAFSLSQDLGITKKEADQYIENYFAKYPKIKQYLDDSIASATEKGYSKTIFGRRRNIPELSSSNFVKRGFGERIAMNTPIQGSSADIIKIAMVKVYDRLNDENLKSNLILQIHDELIIETHKDEIDVVKDILKNEMENATQLLVKMDVDINEGDNWYKLK